MSAAAIAAAPRSVSRSAAPGPAPTNVTLPVTADHPGCRAVQVMSTVDRYGRRTGVHFGRGDDLLVGQAEGGAVDRVWQPAGGIDRGQHLGQLPPPL